MKKPKTLKLWNGRYCQSSEQGDIYIAAYSRADACRMLTKAFSPGDREWDENETEREVGRWDREIRNYFNDGCWGNATPVMVAISKEPIIVSRSEG